MTKDKADEGHMDPVKIHVSIAGHLKRRMDEIEVFCKENPDWAYFQSEFGVLSKVKSMHIMRVCLSIGVSDLMDRIRDYAEKEGIDIDHLDEFQQEGV